MMKEFFTLNYSGSPFKVLSFIHIVSLVITITLLILMITCFKLAPQNDRNHKRFRTVLIWFLLLFDLGYYALYIINGAFNPAVLLPLNFCSISVFICVLMLYNGRQSFFELAYYFGLPGAFIGLIMPDISPFNFPHFRFFEFFIIHGGIILAVFYMLLVEGYRPYAKNLPFVFIAGTVFTGFTGLVNYLLNANYMYLCAKPDSFSILDYFGPRPYYIIFMVILAVLIVLGLYLPFWISDLIRPRVKTYSLNNTRKKKKRQDTKTRSH